MRLLATIVHIQDTLGEMNIICIYVYYMTYVYVYYMTLPSWHMIKIRALLVSGLERHLSATEDPHNTNVQWRNMIYLRNLKTRAGDRDTSSDVTGIRRNCHITALLK